MTNTCVILINKVSDVVNQKRKALLKRDTVPALGASWEHNVDESFEMRKSGGRKEIKEIVVIFSPKCKKGKLLYRIEEKGFTFIDSEGIEYD